MRNILLGSTAFVAAVAMAPYAHAQLEVNLGGFSRFQAGYFDNEDPDSSDRDFRFESEVHVRMGGVADNGLEYGAVVELQTSTNDENAADETYVTLRDSWGALNLGDEDGAADQLSVFAPTVGIGQINGQYLFWVETASRPAGNLEDTGGGMIKPMDTEDSTKVTYYTPRYAGLQAGVSYVPELDEDSHGEAVQFSDASGNQRDGFETGLNYTNRYKNGLRVNAGAAYVRSEAKDGSGREDVSAWGLGLRLGYKEFELGGGYVDNGDSNNDTGIADDDETAWNGGLTYKTGPFGAAITYSHEDYEDNGGRGSTTGGGTYQAVVLGSTYTVAEGLTASADLAFFDRNFETGTDDDGYVLVVEGKAAF